MSQDHDDRAGRGVPVSAAVFGALVALFLGAAAGWGFGYGFGRAGAGREAREAEARALAAAEDARAAGQQARRQAEEALNRAEARLREVRRPVEAPKPEPPKEEGHTPVAKTTPIDLWHEYDAQAVAADEKYRGRYVELSGHVQKADADEGGRPH